MPENKLLTHKHILICIDTYQNSDLDYLQQYFCGKVITKIDNINKNYEYGIILYICGNIDKIYEKMEHSNVNVIKELSYNYDSGIHNIIGIGHVPINVHNQGIYFRNYFDSVDYFDLIKNEHKFQSLTESNKPSNALRKGIYITKVNKNNNEIKFNLLRCSTNLGGSTDNFRKTDDLIINSLNTISENYFGEIIEFNHVLAQIYENYKANSLYIFFMTILNYIWMLLFKKQFYSMKNTQKKAKIKAHSDKTKDMPSNGLIAFCTFYKSFDNKEIKKSENDPFDYCYKNGSVLTCLHFKLKKTVKEDLVKEFTVKLYPNSVFVIPLSTNRLYTHEIKPSTLPIDKIPVRMGYVVRCSKTKAVYKNNQTYIDNNGKYIKLENGNVNDIKKIRDLYFKENTTDEVIDYGNVYFSMNSGDYKKPIV